MPQKTSVTGSALEIRIVAPDVEQPLSEFFSALHNEGDDTHFHPHPLTPEEAHRRCTHTGKDLYYVLIEEQQVLGYGMLRGWDEGFDIPSLGIAVRRSARGYGLATLLMKFLHTAARRRGSKQVILKVYKNNFPARKLYEHLGYTFENEVDGQLLGRINL